MLELQRALRRGRALPAAGPIPVLLLALGFVSCGQQAASSTCRAEAGEPIVVSIAAPETAYPRHLSGTLESVEAPAGFRPARLILRTDDGDRVETIEFSNFGSDLSFPVGKHLEVTVEQVAGFPSYYGITISDEEGLLLAAVSDAAPGRYVLKDAVKGFAIELRDAQCPSRDGGTCYDEIANLALDLRRGSASLTLMQGESGELDGFLVRCLVAEKIVYSSECLDAGRVALSYVIARSDLVRGE